VVPQPLGAGDALVTPQPTAPLDTPLLQDKVELWMARNQADSEDPFKSTQEVNLLMEALSVFPPAEVIARVAQIRHEWRSGAGRQGGEDELQTAEREAVRRLQIQAEHPEERERHDRRVARREKKDADFQAQQALSLSPHTWTVVGSRITL